MESCKGFEDWFACLKCPHLCTKMCPIEGEDVMEELRQRMRLFEDSTGQSGAYFEGSKGLDW
ncbi:MAG: hypothetical protein ACOYU0_03745 [Nitrospirota bacterium]